MSETTQSRSLQISPKYTVEDWRALDLNADPAKEDDWLKAIDILRDRITGRFFNPAKSLIDAEKDSKTKTFGFAILALDCLVLETIQGFRCGLPNHDGQSGRLFREFLSDWPSFTQCLNGLDAATKANEFYIKGRCALHHSGATDNMRVRVSGPMVSFADAEISVNRALFHEELVTEFGRYLAALSDPQAVDLRRKFQRKMDAICGL